ncbi:hypothetical protein [Patiriisocius sp.]|uniref:hypothetical protein n=1 Tax=Patiriisocius sp. TaxID=2822396 RepID=UPI003F4AF2EE
MIRFIILIMLTIASLIVNAQESKVENILLTPQDWGHEHFTFPIGFAREIPLEGIEEAVFPKGWGNVDSPEFWSYAFVWEVDANTPLTSFQFEEYLQIYFDGLMNIRDLKNGADILPTNALFIETSKIKNITNFRGKIRMYEGRYTKKMTNLNVLATQQFCEQEQKSSIIFRFSPTNFTVEIWRTLNNVTYKNNGCEH